MPTTAKGRGAPPTPRRSRPVRIVAAVLIAVMIVAVVGVFADSDDDAAQRTTTTTEAVELTGAGKELFDLLEKKSDATYHARYEGDSPDASSVVIETWQDPPSVRQSSVATVQGQTVSAASFLLPNGTFRCSKLGAEPWRCRAATADEAVADPLAGIAERLSSGEVDARDDRVGERFVRCFSLRTEEGLTDLCVTPDAGIPVSVQAGESRLELVALDDNVGPADFELPAEVAP